MNRLIIITAFRWIRAVKGGQSHTRRSRGQQHASQPARGEIRIRRKWPLPPRSGWNRGEEMRSTGMHLAPVSGARRVRIVSASAHRLITAGEVSGPVWRRCHRPMPGSRYPESTIKSFFLSLETPVPTVPLPRAVDGSCADRVSRRNAGGGARK